MKQLTLLLFAQIVFVLASYGQETLVVDLSKNINSTFTQTIDPQTIKSIRITNRIISQGATYSVKVTKKRIEQPALDMKTKSSPHVAGVLAQCQALFTAMTALEGTQSEADIPKAIEAVKKEMNVPAVCDLIKKEANEAIDKTSQSIDLAQEIVVKSNDVVTIEISRGESKWTYVLETEYINHWRTYFGFTYNTDILTKFPTCFAKDNGDGSYVITQMNGNNKNVFQNLSPTAMFTYRFFKDQDQPFMFGLTGGVMYDLESLGALVGPSLVIGNNLSLNTGIVFSQKNRLLGQYKEGDVVQTNLSFDQLHEKVWTYDLYFSIGLNIADIFDKFGAKKASAAAGASTGSSE